MGNTSRGFTIIETVLFLAISGLLILTIVGGAGVSINIQRYRDGVESLKSKIQDQYAYVTNVENSRSSDQLCGANAKPVYDANGEIRGQSKCMITGKYMRISDTNVATYTVLAYETSDVIPNGASDIDILKNNYNYNTSATPDDDVELDWGTSLVWPTTLGIESPIGATPRTMGILFLKSPNSGQTYTFTDNNVPAKNSVSSATFAPMISNTVNSKPGRAARVLCIASNGLFLNANQSIYIGQNASGPTAIEVTTNEVLTSKGTGTQC